MFSFEEGPEGMVLITDGRLSREPDDGEAGRHPLHLSACNQLVPWFKLWYYTVSEFGNDEFSRYSDFDVHFHTGYFLPSFGRSSYFIT